MSASRESEKRGDNSHRPIPPIDPDIAPELFKRARDSTVSQLKVHLGIPDTGTLPGELKRIAEDRTKAAFSKDLAEILDTDIQSQVKATLKKPAFVVFDEQIKTSLSSTEHFKDLQEMDDILKIKAELLFAKRTAYTNAGFSPAEAMQIVLAEIEGKTT